MDRRDTIKTLLVSGVAASALLHSGCKTEETNETKVDPQSLYGRTPEEVIIDQELHDQMSIFTNEELTTIAILSCLLYTSDAADD